MQARLLLGFLVFSGFLACYGPDLYVEFSGHTMGTTYFIRIVPQRDIPLNYTLVQSDLDSILSEIDKQMSTYRLDSEITKFNESNVGEITIISNEFASVLRRSMYWGKATRGALDITVMPAVLVWRYGSRGDHWIPPTADQIQSAMKKVGYENIDLVNLNLQKSIPGQMIDLNAIAKGWGVDQLFKYFKNKGILSMMVEIGGEVRTTGKNIKGKEWQIGIDTPLMSSRPGQNIFAVIAVANKGMATSGNYRKFFKFEGTQYSHIVDPRTGNALQSNISSVTVLGPTCMDADALATALNVMTVEEGLNLVERLKDFEAFWIIKEGEGQFKSVASLGMPLAN